MKLTIEHRDLFTVPKDYYLCHCISADFALGAGIAKKFAELGVREWLIRNYQRYIYNKGECLFTHATNWQGEYNLVTKEKCWQKPTLISLRESLISMKSLWTDGEKIAMCKIGCGLDKLQWKDVEPIIREVFYDTDTEILICDWK